MSPGARRYGLAFAVAQGCAAAGGCLLALALLAPVQPALAKSVWRTETVESVVFSGKKCGEVATDIDRLPPLGPIGNVFYLRVLNLVVGQKLTDSMTGQVTATVTKIELLDVDRAGADLRVTVVGSDAACSDPALVNSGWVADPKIQVRFLEDIPNTDCHGVPRAKIYGLVAYIISCRTARQLALRWSRRCAARICRVGGYSCDRRPDGLVDCIRGRREASWSRRRF
jgi:hypothetical protein